MFADHDSSDDNADGGGDEDMPRAPMSYRQRNAEKARRARMQKSLARGGVIPDVVSSHVGMDANKVKAAQDLLSCGLRSSLRCFSDAHSITFNWARHLLMTAGSVLLQEQRESFRRLLLDIQAVASRGDVRPSLFTWWRSYDETPRLCRLDNMLADGSLESESGQAKIMCALLGFAMTLQVRRRDHDAVASRVAANSARRALRDGREAWQVHIICGQLACELVPVANQTIPLVANYIGKMLCLPANCQEIVAQVFPATCTLGCTDMHKSYGPAERIDSRARRSMHKAAALKPAAAADDAAVSRVAEHAADDAAVSRVAEHATASFRCSMHRARSSEKSFLCLDDPAERFLMNFTLNLSHNDVLRSFREQVSTWAVDPHVLVWRRSPPSEELKEWRRQMEAVLFSGPPSRGKARRFLFWQHVHTGDPRKPGIIEHLCPGASCCKSRADLEAKVRGPYGVLALLSPPPKKWPRKPWAGQSEVACHVLQCEFTGGMISAHMPLVAKMAASRAMKASERVRALDQADAGRADVANERARALWAETQAEQEQSGCAQAVTFLGSPDAVPRLISLVVVLETYRVMKATILTRNGKQWATAAMAAIVPGGNSIGSAASPAADCPRKMIIKEACQGHEVQDAMISNWGLLSDLSSKKWCLHGVPGTSQDLLLQRWAMAIRAGGGAFLLFAETQRYPWRLFYLFGYDPENGAVIFAGEARVCPNQCFLGELARLHWKRYPSIEALLSEAALADIDSMALLLTDNTALLEAEHAGGKRSARCREDTYLEHVMDSSALRIVKHSVVDSKHWCHTSTEATKEAIPCGGNAASLAADRRSDNAGPGRQGASKKRPPGASKKRKRSPGASKKRPPLHKKKNARLTRRTSGWQQMCPVALQIRTTT